MPRALDPRIAEVLKRYEIPRDAVWDCHGTWVVKHSACELLAAKAGVVWDLPQVLACDPNQKSIAILATGRLETRMEWSIGEAAPGNNKNAYPWAMAEKRAKDRVILKLVGLHGVAYSEEEADDFKGSQPKGAMQADLAADVQAAIDMMDACPTLADLGNFWKEQAASLRSRLTPAGFAHVEKHKDARKAALTPKAA